MKLFSSTDAGIFERLRQSVSRTRQELSEKLERVLGTGRTVDPEVLAGLQAALLAADLGPRTTQELIERLRERATRTGTVDAAGLRHLLREELLALLDSPPAPAFSGPPPQVIFVVGVNGTGKTTTAGKLAWRLQQEQRRVVLAAADTFRAAAIEQLEEWGRRTGTTVVRQRPGADPAAVLFEALQQAQRNGSDVVVVDTAGRLHTKHNLMAELEKMRRVAARLVAGAPHEVLLVLDATTGQNGLAQAREFTAHAGVTGIVLTKLDGTARGGIVVSIARELGLPVRFVGVGEQPEDLLPFDPAQFVASLLD